MPISDSRKRLLRKLLERGRNEHSPAYGSVLAMAEGLLTAAPSDTTLTGLIRELVAGSDRDVFNRAAMAMLLGGKDVPFRQARIAVGEPSRDRHGKDVTDWVAHHEDGRLAAVVDKVWGMQIVEYDLASMQTRIVVDRAEQVVHLSYPFSAPHLAVVYCQDDMWYAHCDGTTMELPKAPMSLVSGIHDPIYHWSYHGGRGRLAISALQTSELICCGVECPEEATSSRLRGFHNGEMHFTDNASVTVLFIEGRRWDLHPYGTPQLHSGNDVHEPFPDRSGTGIPLRSQQDRTFIALRTKGGRVWSGLKEPLVTDGWDIDLERLPIEGIPHAVFVETGEQHLLLATTRGMYVLNRDGRIVITHAQRDEPTMWRDRDAVRPFHVYDTGRVLLLAHGGQVHPLNISDITQSPGSAIALYSGFRAGDLLFHDGALHTLAAHEGAIYHFRWPI